MRVLSVVLEKLSGARKVEFGCYGALFVLCIWAMLFSENPGLWLNGLLFALCVLAVIKWVRRIHGYGGILQKRRHQTRKDAKEHYFSSEPNAKSYFLYVRFILCIWLVFLCACMLVSRLFAPSPLLFLAGVFFLYALDMVFYSAFCFLNYLANRIYKTEIRCCYLCPVRGWDLLMLHLPLLFVWPAVSMFLKPVLLCVLVLSVLGFLFWEYGKFFVLPLPNGGTELSAQKLQSGQGNTPCKNCKRSCGEEYNGRRSCMRRYVHRQWPF